MVAHCCGRAPTDKFSCADPPRLPRDADYPFVLIREKRWISATLRSRLARVRQLLTHGHFHRLTRLKIRSRQCRFVVSDDSTEAISCGAPTLDGSSWCPWHRQRVYASPSPREKYAEGSHSGEGARANPASPLRVVCGSVCKCLSEAAMAGGDVRRHPLQRSPTMTTTKNKPALPPSKSFWARTKMHCVRSCRTSCRRCWKPR